ncbi:MAG: hypothetical protein R3A10_11625 [Caldilineaceae bacterium]
MEPIVSLLAQIDLLLLLAVAPGFGGQAFNPVVLEKARTLAAHRASGAWTSPSVWTAASTRRPSAWRPRRASISSWRGRASSAA